MNIDDILKELREGADKLDIMFERQRELMEKYYAIEEKSGLLQTMDLPVRIDDPAGQARLKDLAWRIVEELGEAMNCLKNKPWKQSTVPTDVDHFQEELADFLHFSLELFVTAGIDARRLFALYFLKAKINVSRQESGY